MKKGASKIIAVALGGCLLLYVLLYAFGDQVVHKMNTSRSQDAEVLGWDPENGTLKVRMVKGSKVMTTEIPINPPENNVYIKIPAEDEDGSEATDIHSLVGSEDGHWETAFCVGDTVRLTSDKFDVSRTRVGETLEVKYIQKTNDAICEQ